MKVPKYPEDFYSFKEGVPMSDEQINKWIEELVKEIYWSEVGTSLCSGSGDTMVMVKKYEDEITIRVSKGYEEGEIFYN